MRKTTNYGLALYDKEDKMNITASENSLNHNMELIDSALKEKANNDEIPTKTSQLANDSNFITSIPSEYITETELTEKKYATETYVSNKIAEAELSGSDVDLSGLATKDELNSKVDKVKGKSLVDDEEITRLKNVTNYDDTELKNQINSKATIQDMTNYIEENKDELKGADGYTPVKGTDYWTEEDKEEIKSEIVTEVPLVKTAEQPEFVDSIEKMTDTSKVYVNDDGYLYAYMKGISSHRFTADDFRYSEVNSDGSLTGAGYTRIPTVELVDLSVGTVSVYCPEPYQYFIYYYTGNDTSTYIGKTSWKSGNIEDVLTDVIASGTINGAKYCRISFRDGTSTNANLNGRMDEFMENIIVTQTSNKEVYEWKNTGFSYNQPADYEDRIVALEQALEGIEYGSY